MLRAGYTLLVSAALLLFGYGGYRLVRLAWRAQAIEPFLKWIIALAAVGLLLTVVGLIWERAKQGRRGRDRPPRG
ncbi:MAG: hypothetical protein ACP5G2_05155 [Candidatus Bipolaricaulaceae bacterium]